MLLIIAAKHSYKHDKEKTPDVIKEELLDSMIEIEEKDKPGLDKAVKNTKKAEEAIRIIKRYEETLNSQNEKIIKCSGDTRGASKNI